MYNWDLKIVVQKDISKEYLEYLLLQTLEINPVFQPNRSTIPLDVIPPVPFQRVSGPLPTASPADMFNYIRKTHILKEPVINIRRIQALAEYGESLRNRLIITLLTGSSLTIKRIINLRVSDVEPAKRRLLIPSDEGSLSSRYILLSSRLTEQFNLLTANRKLGEPLFRTAAGQSLKPSTIQAIYTRALKKAGL